MSQGGGIRAEQILELFDSLPQDENERGEQGFSFSAGAFVRVKVGLRKACKDFPLSITAINSFARSVVPTAVWTSFVLLEREQTSEHKDTANSALPNFLIPISCFSAGELCVRGPSGPGRLNWRSRRGLSPFVPGIIRIGPSPRRAAVSF